MKLQLKSYLLFADFYSHLYSHQIFSAVTVIDASHEFCSLFPNPIFSSTLVNPLNLNRD